ncbi:hypothetical protein [Mycolicibacterium komossense]|uniref:Uncharacterized protein n=1 Tax=Mycolicibacterium komossense TaxID=1779 RepID=A0ABT3CL62_9MYCO|nr:hypothetical protein [Mycolicibacterium komossense]MCV7230241.1 hypothetical protein [Mycolicibacterium komossense]
MAESTHTALQPWQTAAFVAAIICVIVGCIPAFVKLDIPSARRIYWVGWLGAAAFGATAASSRGWSASIAVVVMFALPATLRAYFATPYIKIGGRVIAHSITDTLAEESEQSPGARQGSPADSYGGLVTASKQWWVFAALACILGGAVYSLGWEWRGIFAVVFLSFLGAATGHDDSSRQLPLVRGQRVQALIVVVASIPMLLIPPAAYFLGYELGKRHPHNRSRHGR